ncbi:hypothetical protein BDI4_1050013 [Burkholderia diffusa]|nr:hypothetical protein BDI4_1050013 [Burkholderia diffusa]
MALTGSSCRLHARLCLTLMEARGRLPAHARAGARISTPTLEIYALWRETSMTNPLAPDEQICHGGCRRTIDGGGRANAGRPCCAASAAGGARVTSRTDRYTPVMSDDTKQETPRNPGSRRAMNHASGRAMSKRLSGVTCA